MYVEGLPKSLISFEILDELMALLLEKEEIRHTIKHTDFGSRITGEEEANHLLQKISKVTREALGISTLDLPDPGIELTSRISQLPWQTARLCFVFFPISLLFLYFTLHYSDGGVAVWLVRGVILFLLAFPFIYRRRLRINIEHECGYLRDTEGISTIIIDQLPAIQFQSYLSHEYAHHLYYHYFGDEGEKWMREGWSRLVQWQVARHLFRQEDNSAYLYHVLVQTIGELRFACNLICMAFRMKVPRKVRRIRTIYQSNSLFSFFTGTPGFDVESLVDHGVGTAFYFVTERRIGLKETIWKLPLTKDIDH